MLTIHNPLRINLIRSPIVLKLPPTTSRVLVPPMTDTHNMLHRPHAIFLIRMLGTPELCRHFQITGRPTIARRQPTMLVLFTIIPDLVGDGLFGVGAIGARHVGEMVGVIGDVLGGGASLWPEGLELGLGPELTAFETVVCAGPAGEVVGAAVIGALLAAGESMTISWGDLVR